MLYHRVEWDDELQAVFLDEGGQVEFVQFLFF